MVAVAQTEASSSALCQNGYLRGEFTSKLVNEFINAVDCKIDNERPQLSEVRLDIDTFKKVEMLKTISFESVIGSHRLQMAERRGAAIIKKIFRTLADVKEGRRLLPEDWAEIYFGFTSDDLRETDNLRFHCEYDGSVLPRVLCAYRGPKSALNSQTLLRVPLGALCHRRTLRPRESLRSAGEAHWDVVIGAPVTAGDFPTVPT